MQSLLSQLQALPESWALVAVDANKRPYQPAWQRNPLTKKQAALEIIAGRAKAIGVIAGPPSGGLLFLDHDGESAGDKLAELGVPLSSLPKTLGTTSNRPGRFQLIFFIPAHYWPSLRNRKVFNTGVIGPDGKAENLDLRWVRHQSIVIGQHPITGSYSWLEGCSPRDLEVAEAPTSLIELLLPEPPPSPAATPLLSQVVQVQTTTTTLPLLDFICRDSRSLIETGGTPGQWNDDELRLALDLIGTETWIINQGFRPDISASIAFDQHVAAAQCLDRSFDTKKARQRFDGAVSLNPKPATPDDKLYERLAFHTKQPKPKPTPPPLLPVKQSSTQDDAKPLPVTGKPVKYEVPELLAYLRQQAGHDGIRFNIFTQQIEMDGVAIQHVERFYLHLAELGIKVPKDLAVDCLLEVAHEHCYDPVRLYLEHVAATVEPAYIDALSSAYLRPEDALSNKPTIYDHMLRCTLVAAVRRVFEPGCKFDTACVLMGDQGACKSTFWSALGGPFFSDSLGDISSKDDLMVLHRSWIMEWAELDQITGRKHAGHVKAFLSKSTDMFRVPYGKATEAFPRRGIIVGSTNRSAGFLVDDTGNRRFWVIPTTRTKSNPIDTDTLLSERDAIWSAAVHLYRSGTASFLPSELAELVDEENRAYQVDSPWKAPIEAWLQAPQNHLKPITSELLLSEAIQKPVERQNKADQMQVAGIMRELGYEKRRQLVDGVQKWVYCQPVANL